MTAVISTKIFSGDTETGPKTSGCCENGEGISFATPPQINCSVFCMAIHRPIISSMTESMSVVFSRRRMKNSSAAPTMMPIAVASRMATKKLTPSWTTNR